MGERPRPDPAGHHDRDHDREHEQHHDRHQHGDHHGHHHDRGIAGFVRYLRYAPQMWSSEINDAVVELVDPRPGEHVVDIGAGALAGTVVAAGRGATVTAIEPTPFIRTVASLRRMVRRDRRAITVTDGAAERLPIPDACADAVLAVNSMHHWTDADRAAAEIARVLVPGGRVVLVDEDFDDPAHPDGDDHRHSLEDHGFHAVDPAAMGRRLTDAGLVDVDTDRTRLAGRPVAAVTAIAPIDLGRPSRPHPSA